MNGVYIIENKVDGKKYIGKTMVGFKVRKYRHIRELRLNTHVNNHLQSAWNCYGENNFEFKLVFISDDEDEVNAKEIELISKYNTTDTNNGYNLRGGGEGGFHSDITKNKISHSSRGKNSNLTFDDVRRIKLAMYCLMDRKEISEKFNASRKVLTQISMGKAFEYVNSELNKDIHNIKQRLIDERNEYILSLFDSGLRIAEICRDTGYSVSIVEKCIYKYRSIVNDNRKKLQDIYDKVHELSSKGYKDYHISKKLNISPNTVCRYLRKENNPYLDLPYKKLNKEIQEYVLEGYFKDNKTFKQIADEVGLSDTTIGVFINNYKYTNTEVTYKTKEL